MTSPNSGGRHFNYQSMLVNILNSQCQGRKLDWIFFFLSVAYQLQSKLLFLVALQSKYLHKRVSFEIEWYIVVNRLVNFRFSSDKEESLRISSLYIEEPRTKLSIFLFFFSCVLGKKVGGKTTRKSREIQCRDCFLKNTFSMLSKSGEVQDLSRWF